MQIKRENALLFSVLFTSSEIDFLRSQFSFGETQIQRWLDACLTNQLFQAGYNKPRKDNVNELER